MCFEDYLIERTDELNNAVYALLRCFLMLNGAEADDAFPWNMEIIGAACDFMEAELVRHGYHPCYPYYEGEARTPCVYGKDCKSLRCPLRKTENSRTEGGRL